MEGAAERSRRAPTNFERCSTYPSPPLGGLWESRCLKPSNVSKRLSPSDTVHIDRWLTAGLQGVEGEGRAQQVRAQQREWESACEEGSKQRAHSSGLDLHLGPVLLGPGGFSGEDRGDVGRRGIAPGEGRS